jgi:Tfp pilus assembly protein PilX
VTISNKCVPGICRGRKKQRGYAILLVLFFVTLVVLATISVAPNILTQGRREKEAEMIWRGKQYARGIKLYYRKTGKFPASMDDLTKPKLGSLRFMRQAYKDPMNPKDGEWRLIYVGPTGQLIGSLKPPQTIQLSGIGGGTNFGTPAAQLGAQSAAGQAFGQGLGQAVGQVFGNAGAANLAGANGQTQTNPAVQANGQGANGGNAAAGTDSTATGASTNPGDPVGDAANDALLASDPTTVMGGNIIGVGSKINQRSIVVYEKAKNYKQFEFIWDPSKDAIMVGGAAGPQIGAPAGQPGQLGAPAYPTANPTAPGAPLNPQPGPPDTTPTPPPQQP